MISGIGIDIVEISKVKELVTNYPARMNSIFTLGELNFCRTSTPKSLALGCKRFSVIFAAKEATLKALNTGWERGGDLLDIEIAPLNKGQFQVNLFRRLEQKAREESVKELKGSFSFNGDLAIAQVLALG